MSDTKTKDEDVRIEPVARAICESEKMNPDDPLGGWVHWKEAAKAAIDVIDAGYPCESETTKG